MKQLCLFYDSAPRYREAIYSKIDSEYNCDWFIGDVTTDVKEMNLGLLKSVYRFKIVGIYNKMYWQKSLLGLLFSTKYDTYFVGAETRAISKWVFFFLSSFFFKKKKVYVWTHGYYGKESAIEIKLKNWLYRHVTGSFVYGNYARDLMIAQGIPGDRVFTIHNSLHYDQQRALRESIDLSTIYKDYFGNDNPTLIFIGRLTKVKKLDMVIDALSKLKRKGENYNLVFVGDGVEKQNLEAKVSEMVLQNNVWFYGACYDEKQNAELIYNADLCVSPGNVGLTAMHALVFGCPVITHNCFKWQMPEFEAIHAGVTGDFFEMGSVTSLADCISKWFAEKSAKRDEVRKACFNEIDTQWNPYYQMAVIKKNLKF